MERIYAKIEELATSDPFWCSINTEPTAATFLPDLPHDPRWECLDIGSFSTLGGLQNTSQYENNPNAPNGTWVFPQLGYGQNDSAILFGSDVLCEGKIVADGTINSMDIATLMYAQFEAPPYYTTWRPTSIFNQQEFEPHTGGPDTTEGRTDTALLCDQSIEPQVYQLELATDFCYAGRFPPAPPSAPSRRQLSTLTSYASILSPREQELVALARATTPQQSYDVWGMKWSTIPGLGEWTRLRLPGVVLASELFLINVHTLNGVDDFEYITPPPREDCADVVNPDPNICAPHVDHRDEIVLRFGRRLDCYIRRSYQGWGIGAKGA